MARHWRSWRGGVFGSGSPPPEKKEVLPFIAPHGTLFLMPCHDPRQTPLLSYPGCCTLLSDGKTLAVSVAGAVVHFEATTGRELRRNALPRDTGLFALAADGKQAV